MPDYILFMHNDVADGSRPLEWATYLEKLSSNGQLRGGSAIGSGLCLRRGGAAPPVTDHITGFVKVEADNLDQARSLLKGNPVYEAGGTVEIRELPRTE